MSGLSTKSQIIPLMAGVLAAACWGFATVLSKIALGHIAPLPLLFFQLMASVTFLALAASISVKQITIGKPFMLASALGLLEPGLAYTFGLIGLQTVSASKATLIGALEPLTIIFLSWAFFRERVTPTLLIIALFAIAGVLMVEMPGVIGGPSGPISGAGTGDLLIFASVICAGLYVILTGRLTADFAPVTLVLGQHVVGLLWAALALGLSIGAGITHIEIHAISASIWALIMVSGILQYALTFWLFAISLKRLSANVAGLCLTSIPVFGIITAYLLLGERLTSIQAIGAAIIILSVIMLGGNASQKPVT